MCFKNRRRQKYKISLLKRLETKKNKKTKQKYALIFFVNKETDLPLIIIRISFDEMSSCTEFSLPLFRLLYLVVCNVLFRMQLHLIPKTFHKRMNVNEIYLPINMRQSFFSLSLSLFMCHNFKCISQFAFRMFKTN